MNDFIFVVQSGWMCVCLFAYVTYLRKWPRTYIGKLEARCNSEAHYGVLCSEMPL